MIQNKDVPPEAVIRQMVKERKKLQLEIRDLKMQIQRKEWAIEEFKKWQSKVAERHFMYWLEQGVELMQTPPDEELLQKLKHLWSVDANYKHWEKKMLNVFNQHEKAKHEFRKECILKEVTSSIQNGE